MQKFIVAAILTFLLAPAPYGIAINYETRECAGYWSGDEYVGFTLPVDWKAYYPNDNGLVQTEIGTCKFDHGYTYSAEDCCNQLGLMYVSDSIGEERGQRIVHSEDSPIPDDQIDYYLSIGIISAGIVIMIVLVYILYRELKPK